MTTTPVHIVLIEDDHAGRIFVNGHDIADQTTRFWLSSVPGKAPQLTLQLVQGLLVDGPATVKLTTATRRALTALGWTPPPNSDTTENDDGTETGRSAVSRDLGEVPG
ncbi:MAG: hypothetical protein ACJ72N_06975 [Labedaea sp.]